MTPLEPSSRPESTGDCARPRPDLSVRGVAGEVLVLDRAAHQVHQLNATAGFIWQHCDGRHTTAQIVDALVQAFEVDADTAQAAVRTALRRFAELGLLDGALH
jgi:Coenzyme PQQ synthesis protein D (PqqD)